MSHSPHSRPLSIFVHRASELLTDHESFGDGLICFSLLNGLAERGHRVFAFADHMAIRQAHPNLTVWAQPHRSPANSFVPWEQAWRADQWLRKLVRYQPIDLVWRMHPYDGGCPRPPLTLGRPLIVGPYFYSWPESDASAASGRPRFGVGLQRVLRPVSQRGWRRTLRRAALLICATEPHAAALRKRYRQGRTMALPVPVDPPPGPMTRPPVGDGQALQLIFAANLMPNKNPRVFCDTVAQLRRAGLDAHGEIVGDGPERSTLEQYCRAMGLSTAIRFRGKLPNHEVWGWLRQAHFLVSCSIGEPYGRSIAEAMAVGTPCICHWSGGPADFIEPDSNGLLVEKLTAEAYATAIRDALGPLRQGQKAWTKLSSGALDTASQWTTDVVLSKLEEALRSLVRTQDS